MAAHQAPLSLGFSRQEHWSGLPWPDIIGGKQILKGKRCCLNPLLSSFIMEKKMATDSSILALEIPWTEALSGLQSMGSQRLQQMLILYPSRGLTARWSWGRALWLPRWKPAPATTHPATLGLGSAWVCVHSLSRLTFLYHSICALWQVLWHLEEGSQPHRGEAGSPRPTPLQLTVTLIAILPEGQPIPSQTNAVMGKHQLVGRQEHQN